MAKRKLVSFDWALKKLLRSKANFDILEGFLTELLNQDITILEILESEANKETQLDKFNRVDLKVRNALNEIIIIEVQYNTEYDYLQRILFGTAKVITEHMHEGGAYSKVCKVISVNILYFDLGHGEDYVYHGTTRFLGIHKHDELKLTQKQQQLYNKKTIQQDYPDYYLIKVNQFDDKATDTLDEWIYFLKNAEIKDEFNAKGLKKAQQELDILKLTPEQRQIYDRYQADMHYQASMVESSYGSGKIDGKIEGKIEGKFEGKIEGIVEKSQEDIIEVLEVRFDAVTNEIKERIVAINDPDLLKQLHRKALTVTSLGEFNHTHK